MTAPPTIQTNPLDPVFSGVPIVIPQGGLVNPTWNKWFVDLREKVNVINSTLAAWSGIPPVTGLTPGTYGDTTHYPVITVNAFGLVTDVTVQSVSGGGAPMHVTNASSSYTVALSDVPASSANRGIIVVTSSANNLISINTFANTSIPIGTDLLGLQAGTGTTAFFGMTGVSFVGPTITGGGAGSLGRAIQIATDVWAISGNLAYSTGGDPYWANVISLLHFDGINGSTTITDQIATNTWTCGGNTKLATAQVKFGTASANWPSASVSNNIRGPSNLSPFSGDFTIEFWVFPITNSTSFSACLFCVDKTSGPRGLQVSWLQDNTVDVSFTSGPAVISSNTLTMNAWNYFGFSVSGTSAVINLAGTLTSGTWVVGGGNAANALTFGSHVDGITNFIGSIDEFRLTKGIGRDISVVPNAPFPNT